MFSEQEHKNENHVVEVISYGVTTIIESAVLEPQRAGLGGRAVRRDYRRDATMLESGSQKCAWQLNVKRLLTNLASSL